MYQPKLLPIVATIVFGLCVFRPLTSRAQDPDAASQVKAAHTYWIFLTTGKSTAGVDRDEIHRMQAEHIDNFGRLYKLGKLSAAGPMGDPEKRMRGIVVVHADDEATLHEYFTPDPYVQHGYLQIEPHLVTDQVGSFSSDASETEMDEYQIVLLRWTNGQPREATDELLESSRQHLRAMHQSKQLGLALHFAPHQNDVAGVLIFKKQEAEEAAESLQQIPLVASQVWECVAMPLFMSKGILGE